MLFFEAFLDLRIIDAKTLQSTDFSNWTLNKYVSGEDENFGHLVFPKEFLPKFAKVWSTFIENGAPFELNLDSGLKHEYAKGMKREQLMYGMLLLVGNRDIDENFIGST